MARVKEQILELRAKGYTYNQIADELGCSKSTISYHCGEGQKEKSLVKQRRQRSEKPLLKKLDNFRNTCKVPQFRVIEKYIKCPGSRLKDRIRYFSSKGEENAKAESCAFTYEEFMEAFGDVEECYLTGRQIDYSDPKTYSFDHITPISKGGLNTLDNLGVTCPQANYAKRDLSVEEFVALCLEVVIHFGIVEPIEN